MCMDCIDADKQVEEREELHSHGGRRTDGVVGGWGVGSGVEWCGEARRKSRSAPLIGCPFSCGRGYLRAVSLMLFLSHFSNRDKSCMTTLHLGMHVIRSLRNNIGSRGQNVFTAPLNATTTWSWKRIDIAPNTFQPTGTTAFPFASQLVQAEESTLSSCDSVIHLLKIEVWNTLCSWRSSYMPTTAPPESCIYPYTDITFSTTRASMTAQLGSSEGAFVLQHICRTPRGWVCHVSWYSLRKV